MELINTTNLLYNYTIKFVDEISYLPYDEAIRYTRFINELNKIYSFLFNNGFISSIPLKHSYSKFQKETILFSIRNKFTNPNPLSEVISASSLIIWS